MFFPRIVGDGSAARTQRNLRQRRRGRRLLSRSGEAVVGGRGRCSEPEPLLRANAAARARRERLRSLAARGAWRQRAAGACAAPIANAPRCARSLAARAHLRLVLSGAATLRAVRHQRHRARHALVRVDAPSDQRVWTRVASQIRGFLEELRSAGAFAALPADQAFLVICDERINDPHADAARQSISWCSSPPRMPASIHSFMITHSTRGARVRPVLRQSARSVADRLARARAGNHDSPDSRHPYARRTRQLTA